MGPTQRGKMEALILCGMYNLTEKMSEGGAKKRFCGSEGDEVLRWNLCKFAKRQKIELFF